jgi:hypothetical protein
MHLANFTCLSSPLGRASGSRGNMQSSQAHYLMSWMTAIVDEECSALAIILEQQSHIVFMNTPPAFPTVAIADRHREGSQAPRPRDGTRQRQR